MCIKLPVRVQRVPYNVRHKIDFKKEMVSQYCNNIMSGGQAGISVLVTFPQEAIIEETISALTNDHPYLEGLQKLYENKLQLTLDSIADLLDLDLLDSYGAISFQVVGHSFFASSFQSKQGTLDSTFHQSRSFFEDQSMFDEEIQEDQFNFSLESLGVTRQLQRLTSLEDQVIEEENLKKCFLLFGESQKDMDWSQDEQEEQYDYTTFQAEIQRQESMEDTTQSTKDKWPSLFNGIAVSALVMGGFKALTLFFNP